MNNTFFQNEGVNKQKREILRKCSNSEQSCRKIHHWKCDVNGVHSKGKERIFNRPVQTQFYSCVICIN